MRDSDTREFELATLDGRGLLLSALLLVVAPSLIVAGSIIAQGGQLRHGNGELVAPLICAAVWVVLAVASRRHRATLAGGMLTVRSTVYRCDVPVTALDLDKARVFDREERIELRPRRKRNGVGTPWLKSGHFVLSNGERAFVAVGTGRWRLWLPRRDGAGLLLETHDPRALLDALRAGRTESHPAQLAGAVGTR